MKTLRQYIGLLIAGILLYFLIKPFVQTHIQLQDTTFGIQRCWLVCSFGAILFYWSLYLYPFATSLSSMTQRNVSFRTTFTLFHLANITRYLPGRLWGVFRILSLSKRFGLSKTVVAASLTLHVGIETALGGLITLSLLFSTQMRDTVTGILEKVSGQTVVITLGVIGLIAGFVFSISILSSHAKSSLKTVQDISAPLWEKSFWRKWLNLFISHLFLWSCQGLAFFLFVRSFTTFPFSATGVLTGCYAFAWIVGFLSFLTPGGLGIREWLLGLLLANYMPALTATRIALLCRVWMLSAEIILAATAFFLSKHNQTLYTEKHI